MQSWSVALWLADVCWCFCLAGEKRWCHRLSSWAPPALLRQHSKHEGQEHEEVGAPGDVVAAFLRSDLFWDSDFTDLDWNRVNWGSYSGHWNEEELTNTHRWVRPGGSQTLLPNLPHAFLFSLSHRSSLHPSIRVSWMLMSCCSVCSRLTFPRGHFPRLAECAHFHYETVDFGNVQVSSKILCRELWCFRIMSLAGDQQPFWWCALEMSLS